MPIPEIVEFERLSLKTRNVVAVVAAALLLAVAVAVPFASTAGRPSKSSAAQANAALAFARAQIGKPYQWGATGPGSFDCSGLTMRSWGYAGIGIPRSSSGQVSSLSEIPMNKARPGDILWRPGHVAIYAGNGQVIAAPRTGERVSYKSARKFVKALRP